MGKIFDYADSITIDTFPNFKTSVSVGGGFRSEQTGPAFFRITSDVNICTQAEYIEIQDEIMSSNYGISVENTTIPHGITYFKGDWHSGAAVLSTSGRNVTFDGFNANQIDTAKVSDYIQFPSDTKVYQVTNSPIANSSGEAILSMNTDLLRTPNNNAVAVRGSAVVFKLQLVTIPTATVIKRAGGFLLYKFSGPFEYREVL